MPIVSKHPKPNQRTLNHYFASYQPPSSAAARRGSHDPVQRPDGKQHGGSHNNQSVAVVITSSPSPVHHDSIDNQPSDMGILLARQSVEAPIPHTDHSIATGSTSLAGHLHLTAEGSPGVETPSTNVKRRKSQSDEPVASLGHPTPRAAKRARSSEPPSPPPSPSRPVPALSEDQNVLAPSSSNISTLTSLKSTPSAFSIDRPIYVPSSQSDENSELEEIQSSKSRHDPSDEDYLTPKKQFSNPNISDSSSSPSSMEDLATLLGRTKRKNASAPKQSIDRHISRPAANSKFSLANLKKQHDLDENGDIEMAKAWSLLEQAPEQSLDEQKVDKAILESVVQQPDDSDDQEIQVDKLIHTMTRADVIGANIVWQFFESHPDLSMPIAPPFPHLDGPMSKFSSLFQNDSMRNSTFLSGFAEDIFAGVAMPKELCNWLWQSAFSQSDPQLAVCYIAALKSSQVHRVGSPEELWETFMNQVNARPESLDLDAPVAPSREKVSELPPQQLQQLSRILLVLQHLADLLSVDTKAYAIGLLLRVAIDTTVADKMGVQLALKASITALISTLPKDKAPTELCRIGLRIRQTLSNSVLQNRLISLLPSTLPLTHLFKRHLALSLFLDSPAALECLDHSEINSMDFSGQILSQLKHCSLYNIHPHSTPNYTELAASIAMLDVAIDGGFTTSNLLDTKQGMDKQQEETHNSTIDALSDALRAIFARIIDCGATHMARTEAKAVLERLLNRLEYAVRTRPRARRTVWDAEVDDRRPVKAQRQSVVGSWRESAGRLMEGFVERQNGAHIPSNSRKSTSGDENKHRIKHQTKPDQAQNADINIDVGAAEEQEASGFHDTDENNDDEHSEDQQEFVDAPDQFQK